MTPDQILTFAVVAEYGSISRAAEALHLSQPAVSGQLRLLQDHFGQPLYRRDGRGILLTATGEQLAGLARQLRQTYERTLALRDAIAGLKAGSIAIGASTTPASYMLPYVVASFHRNHPSIDISLRNGNTTEILDDLRRFDFAVIEGDVPDTLQADVAVHGWGHDEVVAIVRPEHPLAGRGGRRRRPTTLPAIPLAEISTYPLVMREPGSGVRHQVMHAFASAGLPMQTALELAGVEGVKEGVRAGLGVGFVSAMAMQHDSSLVALGIAEPYRIARRISIVVPNADSLGVPARTFLQACLAEPGNAG